MANHGDGIVTAARGDASCLIAARIAGSVQGLPVMDPQVCDPNPTDAGQPELPPRK